MGVIEYVKRRRLFTERKNIFFFTSLIFDISKTKRIFFIYPVQLYATDITRAWPAIHMLLPVDELMGQRVLHANGP